MTKKNKVGKNLIWVEDLRLELVIPGRTAAITRAAVDRLINKWTKERIKPGKGQEGRAYIEKETAEKVKDYFFRRHSH